MPQQSKQTNNLNLQEFEAFALIYAAHVDYIYSESEVKYILSKVDKLIYDKMLQLFNSNTDYTCMKIILNHKAKFYKTQQEQNEFFNKLKELFEIDGDYSRIEKSFLEFFQRMTQV